VAIYSNRKIPIQMQAEAGRVARRLQLNSHRAQNKSYTVGPDDDLAQETAI